jgi:O-acetylserine/cysteine efflux transporter
MRAPHLLFLMLINLAWGFNIVPTRLALLDVPPMTAAAVRFVLVAVMCLPWLKWVPGQGKMIAGAALTNGVLMFGFNNIAYATAHNVSALAIAGQLGVPFSLILAIVLLGERIHWPRVIGIILSFAGVAWFSFDPKAFQDVTPLLLSVGGAFAYAVGTLFLRQIKDVHALTIQGWIAVLAVPALLALSMIFEPGALVALPHAPLQAQVSLLFSAVAASMIGHAGLSWLLQRYTISVISPLTLLAPLIGVFFGVTILDTPLSAKMIQGGIVTLLGVAIITVRTAQRSPKPPKPVSTLT